MEHLRGESSRVGLQMGSECRYVFVLEWGDLELVVEYLILSLLLIIKPG